MQDPSVLQERLYCTRLELQKTLALSADADETICRLAAVARRVKQERDEAYVKRNSLMAELQARRNAQVMMAALASGPPAAAFAPSGCYGSRALVPFGRVTAQEQYHARAAGVSYYYASSSSRTSGQDSFDPNTLLVAAAEADSVAPAKATATTTGSGAPGMAGKKKSSGSELGLVVEQILRLSRKKEEVAEAEAPVHDDDDAGTSAEDCCGF
ncbi:hypothetical protein ACQ4PT_028905 [Festuca glaucescens]